MLNSLFFHLIATILMLQQNATASVFSAHENLVGGTWKAESQWSDGTPFKSHVSYEWALDGTILKTKTFGNIRRDGYEFGLRNEGIRAYDGAHKEMVFFEFDIFGGITSGTIKYDGKNIFYQYSYETGEETMQLTDSWEYQDEDHYDYTVGVYEDGHWKQKFLTSVMTRTR
jgi:hypothetical protein